MSRSTYSRAHLGALKRFAVAITALTILGHTVLGFEASYAQPLVALATGYATQLLFEVVEARCHRRRVRFAGGPLALVDFLLSAHISALAVAMLLYFSDRLVVVAFATSVAIASKLLFRAPTETGYRHIFNPSNFAIVTTLLLFPGSVGLVQPWQFTEGLPGPLDWGLFAFICTVGAFLNGRFTRRLPLVSAWLGGFVLQAALRSLLFGTSLPASLAPMTGLAFVLFTFYMAPDPATTPARPRAQVAFGAGIAATYGILMALHVVFALFLSLAFVCAARGLGLYAISVLARERLRRSIPDAVPLQAS